ncbi:unnamed protein product [Ilex paraguariensis]|uniref:Uncharacterized protein n=1 Tax=Ilex paraguariensis TaxID=185542 RepID=A0ABC8TBN2_9AQUA
MGAPRIGYLPVEHMQLQYNEKQVEDVNSLATELAKVTAKERALLEQCKDFLSMLTAAQVKDCSLRTHILLHNRVSTA